MAITTTEQTSIIKLVLGMFNAAPGATNLSSIVAHYEANGKDLSNLADALASNAAFANQFAGLVTVSGIANKMASNFGLTTGTAYTNAVAYFSQEITAGKSNQSIMKAAVDYLSGSSVDAMYADVVTTLTNKYTVALDYSVTKQLSGATIAELQSVVATVDATSASVTAAMAVNSSGTTYTLTTGIDNLIGTVNDDVFNAASTATPADTFTTLDSINGAAGNDILNIAESGSIAVVNATVTNVETANLTASAAIVANTTAWTGLTTINAKSVTGTTITAAATTDVNEAASIAATTINGGKDVTITHTTAGATTATATAGALNITSSVGNVVVGGGAAATNALGAVTVNMGATAVGNAGTIEIDGATSFAVTATGAKALATRTADAAAKTASAAAETAANTADTTADTLVTNLTTFAGKYSAANAASDTVAESNALTLAELAAGRITLANKGAIDAAYYTAFSAVGGTATLAQAAALALITPIKAAAVAAVVVTAAAQTAAIAADAAQDTIATANTALLDAVDNMVVTATQNTALTSATITGNYGAAVSAITDASTSNNTLTTVTANNAGVITATGLAIATVNLANQTSKVTVVNATAANTLALNLDSVNAVIDLSTGGGTSTTVNLGLTGTNTINTLAATATTALNISGTGNLTSATALGQAAAVITSTGTGNITTTVTSGQTYTGGTGVDTITTGTVAQTKAVDGGAGIADQLVVTHANNAATTPAALFSNFEVLNVSGTTTVDATKFTNSTFTSVVASGGGAQVINGLNATQAAAVSITSSTGVTLGVTGAATPGQIDTVNITHTDATAALALSAAGVEKINIASTTALTIGTLANVAALTDMVFTGAGNLSVTSLGLAANTNTVINASAVTGTVTIDASGSTTNGMAITGSATKANTLSSSDAAVTSTITGGSAADTITGGAGNDTIVGGEGHNTLNASDAIGDTGADTITAGNGNNTVTGAAGIDTITLGNGYNTVTSGAGADVITFGTGGNTVTGGTGADVITFGVSAANANDTIIYSATAAETQEGVIATGASLATADKYYGIQTGDTVDFSATANIVLADGAIAVGTTYATATANLVKIVSGSLNTTTNVFTAGAASVTNNDYILQFNAGTSTTTVNSAVLVDIVGTLTAASVGEVVTFTVA